jgi:hypothetical protein
LRLGIGFTRWLPSPDDAIEVTDGDMTIRSWIDRTCLQFGNDNRSDEEIARSVNMHCDSIQLLVTIEQLEADLADFIVQFAPEQDFTPEHIAATYDPEMVLRHTAFGERVYAACIKYVNRLIGYLRAVKGQYWVDRYEIDTEDLYSELTWARASVRVRGGPWLRLSATGIGVFRSEDLGPPRVRHSNTTRRRELARDPDATHFKSGDCSDLLESGLNRLDKPSMSRAREWPAVHSGGAVWGGELPFYIRWDAVRGAQRRQRVRPRCCGGVQKPCPPKNP